MSRLIINNGVRDMSDTTALELVCRVTSMGKISGEGDCYCYGTKFEVNIRGAVEEVMVYASVLKSGTHKFNIW